MKKLPLGKGCLLGTPGKDLRFIGVFTDEEEDISKYDLEKIDMEMDFNGDHSFLKKHPEFYINNNMDEKMESVNE